MGYPLVDGRLKLLASLVPKGRRLADVGTDHGHLVCHLVDRGHLESAVAADLRPLPLENARKNSLRLAPQQQEKIAFRLCDGLTGISRDEADVVVIAGMGGELIWEIIDRCPWAKDSSVLFLLQPMTKPELLRHSLLQGGFSIQEEHCALSAGKAYGVMVVRYTGEPAEADMLFACAGRVMEHRGTASEAYIKKQIGTLRKKAVGAAHAGQDALEQEYRKTAQQLEQWLKGEQDGSGSGHF